MARPETLWGHAPELHPGDRARRSTSSCTTLLEECRQENRMRYYRRLSSSSRRISATCECTTGREVTEATCPLSPPRLCLIIQHWLVGVAMAGGDANQATPLKKCKEETTKLVTSALRRGARWRHQRSSDSSWGQSMASSGSRRTARAWRPLYMHSGAWRCPTCTYLLATLTRKPEGLWRAHPRLR